MQNDSAGSIMGENRTDRERLASIETSTNAVLQEISLMRQTGHQRLKDENEWRSKVDTRLALIERAQTEGNENIRHYQTECTDDREDIAKRVSDAEDEILVLRNLRGFITKTAAGIVSIMMILIGIVGLAWAKK